MADAHHAVSLFVECVDWRTGSYRPKAVIRARQRVGCSGWLDCLHHALELGLYSSNQLRAFGDLVAAA